MERIMAILGLRVHNECVQDRFSMAFIKALNRMAHKLMNSFENLGEEEKEIVPLGKRKKYLDWNKDKAYEKALRLLAKVWPEYKKFLPRAKFFGLSDLLKKKIRLAVWVGTGNVIPFQNLREVLVKELLKQKGYIFKRDELRWYHGNRPVGENLFEALTDLEKLEAVDRTKLTISF